MLTLGALAAVWLAGYLTGSIVEMRRSMRLLRESNDMVARWRVHLAEREAACVCQVGSPAHGDPPKEGRTA